MILPVFRRFQRIIIARPSMEPCLMRGDKVLAYSVKSARQINRGDTIFYKIDNVEKVYVKRAIGLPGETVKIAAGMVYINGQKLNDFVYNPDFSSDHDPIQIPNEGYFILGDNGNHSIDSRNFGSIPFKNILYKGLFIYRPIDHFKILIKNPLKNLLFAAGNEISSIIIRYIHR